MIPRIIFSQKKAALGMKQIKKAACCPFVDFLLQLHKKNGVKDGGWPPSSRPILWKSNVFCCRSSTPPSSSSRLTCVWRAWSSTTAWTDQIMQRCSSSWLLLDITVLVVGSNSKLVRGSLFGKKIMLMNSLNSYMPFYL